MSTYSITSNCTGCTLCARSCPVQAIKGTKGEMHRIDENACIRCGLCGKLCAQGAIKDPLGAFATRVPKKEWPKPAIDTQECAGCSLCIITCPKGCLELSEPTFFGDTHTFATLIGPNDCIGCGLCASACPVDAICMETANV